MSEINNSQETTENNKTNKLIKTTLDDINKLSLLTNTILIDNIELKINNNINKLLQKLIIILKKL